MATKRLAKPSHTKLCIDRFKTKEQGDGSVVIEGWANKAVVDRGNDIIPKSAWNLDNFKKTSTILFNHDRNKPIGKALGVEARDEGLYIKAQISNSQDKDISMVRDLIKEGMLSAFSVGFEAKDEIKNAEGVNEIKAAELYEVSVVTVPMNQDSTFSLSSKDLKNMTIKQAKDRVLKEKGAQLAMCLQGAIYGKQEKGGFDKEAALKQVMELSGASEQDMKDVLSGDLTGVDEKVLLGFAGVLGLDVDELKKLDEADASVGKKPKAEEQPSDVPPVEEAPKEDEHKEPEPKAMEDEKPEGECPPEKKEVMAAKGLDVAVYAVLLPKDKAPSLDEAKAWAEQNGWKVDQASESDAGYVMIQEPAESFSSENFSDLDLGDGVVAKVGVLGAKEPDPSEPPPSEDAPPAEPVAKGVGTDPTTPVQPMNADQIAQNPQYDQMKQTNVILGSVLQVLQQMSEKLDKLVVKPIDANQETPPLVPEGKSDDPADSDPTVAKMMVDVGQYISDTKQRLERLKSLGIDA